MGRPLEFIETEVIGTAVDTFRREGFGSVSASALASAMGLSKSSLYNTFGSKKGVLLHAVAHYATGMHACIRALGGLEDVAHRIRQMVLDVAQNPDDRYGCLLVNMSTEFGARDEQVRASVQSGFVTLQKAFIALIEEGQARGTISPDLDATGYAFSLVTGIAGIRVMAKAGFPQSELMPFIELLLLKLAT